VLQWRATSGDAAQSLTLSANAPLWVRLVRVGTTITAYASDDGAVWQQVGSQNIALKSAVAGLAVASGDAANFSNATFERVNLANTI
jgi:hypothetical protein